MTYSAQCTIKVYDFKTSNIKNVFFGRLHSGNNLIELSSAHLNTGLYILRILYDDKEISKIIEIIH